MDDLNWFGGYNNDDDDGLSEDLGPIFFEGSSAAAMDHAEGRNSDNPHLTDSEEWQAWEAGYSDFQPPSIPATGEQLREIESDAALPDGKIHRREVRIRCDCPTCAAVVHKFSEHDLPTPALTIRPCEIFTKA